jgi:hypothetical protein
MRLSGISAIAICAALLCSPVGAASINLGGQGGLLGTGLLSGSTTGSGGNTASATVNTGGGSGNGGLLDLGGGNGGLLDLGGGGSQTATGNVNLGDTGQGNVLLDLFGNGGQDGNAQVTLGMNGLNSGADTSPGTGDVRLDLFGNGSGGGSGTGSGATDLFGGGSGGGGATISGHGISIASLETRATGAGCFSPNANQLSKLAGRHDYTGSTFATWNNASVVKVIDVGLCSAAAHTIAAQPNIGRLQTYVGGKAVLRDQLAQWGHKPGDVIAVDRQGQTLIFYVT